MSRYNQFLAKVMNGEIVPITPRCAVNMCRTPSVGLYAWPDEDTMVRLCGKHAKVLMARMKGDG